MYNSNIEIIYLDNFGTEHVPNEIIKFIGHKNRKANTFRIQAKKSILCGHFCIGFIDLMFAGKTLIYYSSFFSPFDFEKQNDNIVLRYFKND